MIRIDQDITITMTAGEWQLVMQGAAELPYKLVAAVIQKLEQNFREAAEALQPGPAHAGNGSVRPMMPMGDGV